MPVIMLSGGFPGTTPDGLSGLLHWWDFSDSASLWKDAARTSPVTAHLDQVLGVTDKGSAAEHLSSVNGPAYYVGLAGINGNKVVLFDTVNDILATSVNVDRFGAGGVGSRSGTYTIMAVLYPGSTSAEGGGYNPGRSYVRNGGLYALASSSSIVNPNFQNHDSTSGSASIARKAMTLSTWAIVTAQATGNGAADPSWTVTTSCGVSDTRDASLATNAPAGGNYNAQNGAITVGGNATAWADAFVAEIVWFRPKLSEANRMSLEKYWSWKYGIALPY
jgi:hypothetical protein